MRLSTSKYLCSLLLFTSWGCVVPTDRNNDSTDQSTQQKEPDPQGASNNSPLSCEDDEFLFPSDCEGGPDVCVKRTFHPPEVPCFEPVDRDCTLSTQPHEWCQQQLDDPAAECQHIPDLSDENGCLPGPIYDYEFCGMASSEEGCQQMGCDLVLNGLLGTIEGDACLLDSNRPWEHACFKNNGTRRVMHWGNLTSFYVRESAEGETEVLYLSNYYDPALHDWTNCQDLPNDHPCHFCL